MLLFILDIDTTNISDNFSKLKKKMNINIKKKTTQNEKLNINFTLKCNILSITNYKKKNSKKKID